MTLLTMNTFIRRVLLTVTNLLLVVATVSGQLFDYSIDTIQPPSVGDEIISLKRYGDRMLFLSRDDDRNHSLSSTFGLQQNTRRLSGFDPDRSRIGESLGSIGSRQYTGWNQNPFLFAEIDFATDDIRLFGSNEPGFFTTDQAMAGRFLYNLSSTTSESDIPALRLIQYDPIADTSAIVWSRENTTGLTSLFTNLVAYGRHVYFTAFYDGSQYAFVHDSETLLTTNLGIASDDPRYPFLRNDGGPILRTIDAAGRQAVTVLSPSGIGPPLRMDGTPILAYGTDDYALVANFNGSLYGVDLPAGQTAQVVFAQSNDIFGWPYYAPYLEGETVFAGSSLPDQLYLFRTDGTTVRTRQFLQQTVELSNQQRSVDVEYVANLNGIIAVIYNTFRIALYDPQQDVFETFLLPGRGRYSDFTTHDGKLYYIAKDPDDRTPRIYVLSTQPSEYLRGTVYNDANQDRIRQDDEGPVAGALVNDGTGQLSYTNAAGEFIFRAEPGTNYTLRIVGGGATDCVGPTTPRDEIEVTFDPSEEYDFELAATTIDSPAGVTTTLALAWPRCNTPTVLWATVVNDGCAQLSGSATVRIPEGSTYVESEPAAVAVNGRDLHFDVTDLPPGTTRQFRITVALPDERFTGQTLQTTLLADLTSPTGLNLLDTVQHEDILRCAYDPNDKQVSPSRAEPSNSNYTQFDETLTYTIRFQNTGNDTAYTVRLEDQLPDELSHSTFKPLAASHPYTSSLSESGRLIFLFENIFLPDSTTDLAASQGFVSFQIQAGDDLTDFATADNYASIFFDANQPIITNTVTSTFVEKLDADKDGFNFYEDCNDLSAAISPAAMEVPGNQVDENCDGLLSPVGITEPALIHPLQVYPNPTTGVLTLRYAGNETLLLTLFTSTGQTWAVSSFTGEHRLDLSHAPKGHYLLRVLDRITGAAANRWILVQ